MTLNFRARTFFPALLLLMVFVTNAWPQTVPTPAPAKNDAAAKPEKDPFGRETPQGMVAGLMNALAAADYERAVQFFQTDSVQGVRQWFVWSGPALAKRFQEVLDRAGNVVTPAELSNDPNGNVKDGLAQDEERFGEIKTSAREVPLLAKRITRDGKTLWLVSGTTLNEIPALARALKVGSAAGPWLDLLPQGPSCSCPRCPCPCSRRCLRWTP